MKWSRKSEEFSYAPYISEDGKYRVQDMTLRPTVEEYDNLKKQARNSKESRQKFLDYCKERKISLNGANWAVVNNITGEPIAFPFKTAKAAKEYAEAI